MVFVPFKNISSAAIKHKNAPSINYCSLLKWLVIIYMKYPSLPCVSLNTCFVIIFSCKGEFVNVRQIFVTDGSSVWLTSPIKPNVRQKERPSGVMDVVSNLPYCCGQLPPSRRHINTLSASFPHSLGMQKAAGKKRLLLMSVSSLHLLLFF